MKNQQTRTRTIKPEYVSAAQTVFTEHLKMNAAKKVHDGLRKTLLGWLETDKLTGFRTEGTDLEGKPVTIDVNVATPSKDIISVRKLLETVFPNIAKAVSSAPAEEQ